ncbi:hypothetical protein [Gracilibacillus massiliensis]|uniref:hypothetical protein n=1 Tax=Gracilibacillus massiliensis TaxID=1564956 RepID=UPI00071E5508|nr:hypothetical protein [Gracilibacillus massiliensis]
MSNFDREWKSLSQKVKLSKHESEEMKRLLSQKIQEPPRSRKFIFKPLVSIVAVACIITILLLSNGNTERITPLSDTTEEQVEDDIMVVITNNATFDFLGVNLVIHQPFQRITGPTSVNADSSFIDKGDSLYIELIEREDFDSQEKTSLEAVIIMENNDRVTIEPKVPITVEKGREYHFEIVGNSVEEAQFKRLDGIEQ